MSTEEVDLKLEGEEDLGYINTSLFPWVKSQLEKGKAPESLKMPEGYYLNFYGKHKKFTISHDVLSVIFKQ